MTLYCSLCIFEPINGEVQEAITVMNGQAVCEDHNGYVQGGDHALALATLLRRREARR